MFFSLVVGGRSSSKEQRLRFLLVRFDCPVGCDEGYLMHSPRYLLKFSVTSNGTMATATAHMGVELPSKASYHQHLG